MRFREDVLMTCNLTEEGQEMVKNILNQIPKEYHSMVKEFGLLYQTAGAKAVLDKVKRLSEIPPDCTDQYDVWHEDNLDGG